MPVKIHLGVTRRSAFGGTLNTSLCGRLRCLADGMNTTDEPEAVTCTLCVAKLAAKRAALIQQ